MTWKARRRNAHDLRVIGSSFLIGTLTALILTSALTDRAGRAQAKPVKIDFIGESLCPDCAAYTTRILRDVFSSGLNELIQLNYLGWGNAKNESGVVTCQHGPRECKLNVALNCAQRISKSQEVFFTFLDCLEREAFGDGDKDLLLTCSDDAQLSVQDVTECTEGQLGKELEAHAAAATPPHPFVPWILVDGVPLGSDCGNLVTYICTAYNGSKPDICYKAPKFVPCPGAPLSVQAIYHGSVL